MLQPTISLRKSIALFAVLFLGNALAASSQTGLSIDPQQPQAGETIRITYTPSGNLLGKPGKVEAVRYINATQARKADDLVLVKRGNSYTASIETDTADNFIQLGFYIDKEFDTNLEHGHFIILYDGSKPKKGSHISLTTFHQYYSSETGLVSNEEKALAAMDKEFELYPDQKKRFAGMYYRIYRTVKNDDVNTRIQQDIESQLRSGLTTEEDFDYLVSLYEAAKLPAQSAYFQDLRKQKYPEGKWMMHEQVQQYMGEGDLKKKEALFKVLKQNIENNPDWSGYKNGLSYFESNLISLYAKNGMWDEFRKAVSSLSDKDAIASNYNNVAWSLQEKNENLPLAEEFATIAMNHAKAELKKPTGKKPDYVTGKNWQNHREAMYSMYGDTYAMVKFRQNQFRQGLDVAKEIAFTYKKGKDTHANTTYALLAEKIVPAKELRPQLEKMVKEGASSTEVNEVLKKLYVAANQPESGFEAYLETLGKDAYARKMEEVRKTLISEITPAISLVDASGKNVTLADFKGKIVVLDFWATWCGPCIKSFPGMQKVVDKYKDSPDVKILFVNTWERGDDKIKKIGEFIAGKNYTFELLFDMDNTAAEKLNINGIPVKFVLDQEGVIRFKSMGYHGSDIGVINEISAMVQTLQEQTNN